MKDFNTWLKGFDAAGSEGRAAHGLGDLALARGVDDPNLVDIVFEVTNKTKAKVRLANPALKKMMMEAGVEGVPTITFYTDSPK